MDCLKRFSRKLSFSTPYSMRWSGPRRRSKRRRPATASREGGRSGTASACSSRRTTSCAAMFYRARCHEILERVAKNEDTRPGTDAEMIVVLHESSLVGPLKSAAACLYFRLINRSMPELARVVAPEIDVAPYEKLHGRTADDYEADLRRKLRTKPGSARSPAAWTDGLADLPGWATARSAVPGRQPRTCQQRAAAGLTGRRPAARKADIHAGQSPLSRFAEGPLSGKVLLVGTGWHPGSATTGTPSGGKRQ